MDGYFLARAKLGLSVVAMEAAHQEAGCGGGGGKICRRKNDGKTVNCMNVSGDNKIQYCDEHYKDFTDFYTENPSLITANKSKCLPKKKVEEIELMKKNKLPLPDEHLCRHNNGLWRCKKNLRMGHGAAAADDHTVPKTSYCEKHFNYRENYRKNQRRSGDGAGSSAAIGIETKGSKKRKKVSEEEDDGSLEIQPPTTDTIGRKTENVERTQRSGELQALTGIKEPKVELENLEHYKSKCFEFSVELEKKKVECTTLQGKLEEVEEARKTATTDGTERAPADATECWRKMFSDLTGWVESRISDLENIVLRMDNKISTMEGCVESRISKLESLVLRSGKESSILRCVQLRHSEKIESEAQGSQNDVTQSGEKLRDENDRKDSDVYECKTKEKVLNVYDAGSLRVSSEGENVEERKGWGCSEERPSQHGSSSQDHLEMSTEPFVNLVSDDDSVEILGESEDSDSSTDSEHSLGTLMDMLAMKYRNRNKDKENKWKCETDMLSSFEEKPDLCMKAVCALYRQQISGDEISDKGLLHNSDALRYVGL